MKVTTLLTIVIAFALGAVSATVTIGCPETRLRFEPETGKVVPVVKKGDVIVWDVPIAWWFPEDNPCDLTEFTRSSGTRCKVVKASPVPISYYCTSGEAAGCDPDIVVDDPDQPIVHTVQNTPGGSAPKPAVARRLSDPFIRMKCDVSADPDVIKLAPADKNDRTTGETIEWISYDQLVNFKATFEGTEEEKKKFCSNGDYELTKDEVCDLAQPSGTSIYYTVTADNCYQVRGKVTVK